MSYDNAEPKILKTLNSSGQVLDDSGKVIADTTDYWEKVYKEAEPKPDKILHSDGTIKDGAGNLIQDTTPFNVKKYIQSEPIPAKYLHADGTVDENPGFDLEDNHQVTIDVSTYTNPVEITPTQGKDGMKKATVTLDNIPSGGINTLFAWVTSGFYVYTTTATPTTQDKVFVLESDGTAIIPSAITEVGEDSITVEYNTYTYERDATGDISLT